jgi:hypothetical protein
MRPAFIVPALLCASLTASSCSEPEGGPLGFQMFDRNHHVASAEPLFSPDEDECITAGFLMSVFSNKGPSVAKEKPACQQLRTELRDMLPDGMNLYAKNADAIDATQRNQVIATLVLASNQRCGNYVHFLQTYQGNLRSSGLASQAFATLATLATGNTAQWLAAGSSFATGAGNTAYDVHFANKTVAMLTQAFDNARLDRVQAIEDRMQCTAAQYPLPQAMSDVFDYHTACSLTTGLMQAQDAVNQQRSPDLDTLAKLADQVAAARASLLKLDGASAQSHPATATASHSAAGAAGGQGSNTGDASTKKGAASGNTVASAAPGTGTGGSAPKVQTHVPTCPFDVAKEQTGASKVAQKEAGKNSKKVKKGKAGKAKKGSAAKKQKGSAAKKQKKKKTP